MVDKIMGPDTYGRQTLERYTGSQLDQFRSNTILCNFQRYVDTYASISGYPMHSANWSVVHDEQKDISIINFGIGSPMAGIVMHCLSFLDNLECVVMLGMCGGIDNTLELGDFLIPTASVRDEGTSRHYLPRNVPAQPSFSINRVCEAVIRKETGKAPKSGIMITTDYRMWEFDQEFIDYILNHRILAIDMEIATLFAVGYALNVPIGAIMLISDLPLREGGIKGKDQAREIFKTYTEKHMNLGIKTFEEIKRQRIACRHERSKCEW